MTQLSLELEMREDDAAADCTLPAARKVSIKYRCPMTLQAWTGRGQMPEWLKAGMEYQGKTLADFEVVGVSA